MTAIRAWAARDGEKTVSPWSYTPREMQPTDVVVRITHCGVCHSDVHQVDNDWGLKQKRPLVPGHEIVGEVIAAGKEAVVRVGTRVGVSPQVGSCGTCTQCLRGTQQYCRKSVDVYQGIDPATQTRNHGGFAEKLVVDSRWAYPIPTALPSPVAAPLLCAGATVFSPLKRWGTQGCTVGVVGIGGLGHLAIQFAAAMGYKVVAISSSNSKEQDAKDLGATSFVNSSSRESMGKARGTIDLMLVTASANLKWDLYMTLLAVDGVLCLLGIPTDKVAVKPFVLTGKRVAVTGSAIASPAEIREMLEVASTHGVRPKIHELPMSEANKALDRVRRGEPRFRDVLVQDFGRAKL